MAYLKRGTSIVKGALDYEEGVWTATPADAADNTSASTIEGQYTKVGRMVSIHFGRSNISSSGLSSTQVFQVRGLPFTARSMASGNEGWVGVAATARLPYPADSDGILVTTPYVMHGQAKIQFWNSQKDSYYDSILVSQINSGGSDYQVSITYYTDE